MRKEKPGECADSTDGQLAPPWSFSNLIARSLARTRVTSTLES